MIVVIGGGLEGGGLLRLRGPVREPRGRAGVRQVLLSLSLSLLL